jgi:flagellar motor protein MotB
LLGIAFCWVGLFSAWAQAPASGGLVSDNPAAQAEANAGAVQLTREYSGAYNTVERSDLSRYDNGRYTGHVYREVRSSINPLFAEKNGGAAYDRYGGTFFVLEETLRDMRQNARGVDAVIPVRFSLFRDGTIRMDEDPGFPALRGFPVFPREAVKPGTKWTAPGSRLTDPLNQGRPVTVPILVEYQFRGIEEYRNIPVYRISARYASRYQGYGPDTFTRLQGVHEADILIRVSDGLPLMMRDSLDETYTWPDGSTVRFRGFTLTFGEGTIPLDRPAVIASLENTLGGGSTGGGMGGAGNGGGSGNTTGTAGISIAGIGGDKDIDVTEVSGGIRLTIRDLRFTPDSAKLLPGEWPRLDLIAQALKGAPDRTFLVEGHTAAVGRPAGEMELSLERAKGMVNELVSRGIEADRFIYKGWGGTKPLGDNSNEAGRRLNRRVEITILE